MKTKAIALTILLFSACVPVRVVHSQKEFKGDLSMYKTFSYFKTEKSGLIGPNFNSNLELLKKAISKEMNALGITEVENNGDLLVNIGIVVKEEVQTRETDIRTDGMRYMGQRNYHWESQEIEVDRYKEGTVKVEMVDAAHNEGLWSGSVAGTVTDNQEKTTERINEAIALLFKKFPATKK